MHLLALKTWKFLTATLKCICKDSLTDVLRVFSVLWCKIACYPARRKSAWYTLMRFRLIKNGVAHAYEVYTVYGRVFWQNFSSKHPYVPQLAKMASVCRLCGSSVAYSHHRVALFGKKASQERLASRISALLDTMITLNDDDGLLNLRCAKCKQSLETVMIDLTKFKRSVAVLQSELSLHAIEMSWQVYYIESKLCMTSHNTEESEKHPGVPISWGD